MYDQEKAAESRRATQGRIDSISDFLARAFRANIYDHPHKSISKAAQNDIDLFAMVAAEALVSRSPCVVCHDNGPVDGGICGGCGSSHGVS